MEAQRVKREEDRINRLEAEEVSWFSWPNGALIFETVMLINQVVDYLNLLRLKEDELMQLSKITKMNCVAKPLQKQTKTCMMVKIWSKLLNQKCSCVMLHMSNKPRKRSELESSRWTQRSKSTGKMSRNKRWQSMMRRWKRNLSKSML